MRPIRCDPCTDLLARAVVAVGSLHVVRRARVSAAVDAAGAVVRADGVQLEKVCGGELNTYALCFSS